MAPPCAATCCARSRSVGERPRIAGPLAEEFRRKVQRLLPGYAPQSASELLEWVKERLFLPLAEWQELLARDRSRSPRRQPGAARRARSRRQDPDGPRPARPDPAAPAAPADRRRLRIGGDRGAREPAAAGARSRPRRPPGHSARGVAALLSADRGDLGGRPVGHRPLRGRGRAGEFGSRRARGRG